MQEGPRGTHARGHIAAHIASRDQIDVHPEFATDSRRHTDGVQTAGLNYIHVPFNAASPDPAVVHDFLEAITDKANQPAFIHCASANRAAALWMIKRLVIDKWDVERASTEAAELGLTNPALKAFAIEQAQRR